MDLSTLSLAPQVYGVSTAQGRFGMPQGIWLECVHCENNDRIVGCSDEQLEKMSNAEAELVFRRGGWTSGLPNMREASCPSCSGLSGSQVAAGGHQ